MRNNFHIGMFFLILFIATDCHAQEISAIVGIYAKQASGEAKLGTGFYISPDGHILTAYHTIYQAVSLQVWNTQSEKSDRVIVEAIYPAIDLAEIKVMGLTVTNYFPIDKSPVDATQGDNIEIYGHPHGLPFQKFTGTLADPNVFVMTSKIWHEGRRVFRDDIEVIALDISSDKGISGGPVLHNNKVIGVLSASLHPGRGPAWAIPIASKFAHNNDLPKPTKPSNIMNWPDSGLMAGKWNSLAAYFSIDLAASKAIAIYEVGSNDLQKVYDDGFSLALANLENVSYVFGVLNTGIIRRKPLRLPDLNRYEDAVAIIVDQIHAFSQIAGEFQKVSSGMEEARSVLKPRIRKKIGELEDSNRQKLADQTLKSILSSKESAQSIFMQALLEMINGVNEIGEAFRHRQHLYRIVSHYGKNSNSKKAINAVDDEIRELLTLHRDAIFRIKGALEAISSSEMRGFQALQLDKLRNLLKVGELTIYLEKP